jgi:hypothetical protein
VVGGGFDCGFEECAHFGAQSVGHRLAGTRDERAEEAQLRQPLLQLPGSGDHRNPAPAVAYEDNVGQVPPLDLIDEVADSVGQP